MEICVASFNIIEMSRAWPCPLPNPPREWLQIINRYEAKDCGSLVESSHLLIWHETQRVHVQKR